MPATPLSSTALPTPSGTRPWWRVRLSLKALMVLVLVIGAPLGWLARRASIQRRAVAAVQAIGGTVAYNDEIDQWGWPRLPHKPWGPRWLRSWIGDEFFQEVAWVTFDSANKGEVRLRISDESIGVLNDLDHLQGLIIEGPNHGPGVPPTRLVTATGLAKLTGLRRLRVLQLILIGTDAAMLALLPHWPTLEDATVRDHAPTIPGASLAHLARLPRLKVAVVDSVESSAAADVAPLAELRQLEQVIILRSPPSDRGVERFGALPRLQLVNLLNTQLTAPTLEELAHAPKLTSLSFDGSQLGPGGFQALAGMRKLAYLAVMLDGQGGRSDSEDLVHRVPARFGDADLDALRHVPLTKLAVMGLDATDAGAARLLQTHSFRSLTLSGRGITDASIPLLIQQPRLEVLVLADTGITDTGLTQLAAGPNLSNLVLIDNAALTDGGVAQLATFPILDSLVIRQPGAQQATLNAVQATRSKAKPFSNPPMSMLNLLSPENAAR